MVATDDQRIFDAVIAFGGNVVMTDPKCNNGTERCLEVLQAMQAQGEKYDIVVNIQVLPSPTPLGLAPAYIVRLAMELHIKASCQGLGTVCTSQWSGLILFPYGGVTQLILRCSTD